MQIWTLRIFPSTSSLFQCTEGVLEEVKAQHLIVQWSRRKFDLLVICVTNSKSKTHPVCYYGAFEAQHSVKRNY